MVVLTNMVLSSSLVPDVEDGAALIIEEDFPVPPDDGHVELVIGGEDLDPALLFLPDLYGKLGPMVGIVGKEAEWVTYTAS